MRNSGHPGSCFLQGMAAVKKTQKQLQEQSREQPRLKQQEELSFHEHASAETPSRKNIYELPKDLSMSQNTPMCYQH